ncbi:MAG: UDP-2,4-diacetamido-2,4,6-trideoxy-beta-L-altropyranose hydrolase, partial [Bacteroidales bacterium]
KDKGCKLVCIDDMHDKHYVADVVINHGLNDSKLFNTEQYTKLCLGLNWAMLRKPFLTKPIIVKIKPIGSIAVCFGGVDKLNLNRKVVELLTKLPHISKIEIIGGYDTMPYDNLPANIILKTYRNVDADQIVSIFKNNDCAILSASTICIEALACSIPVIAGYYVDNQVGLYNYLNNSKYIYGIGNILEPEALNKKLPEYISVSNFNLQKDINLDFSSVSENYINLFRGLC